MISEQLPAHIAKQNYVDNKPMWLIDEVVMVVAYLRHMLSAYLQLEYWRRHHNEIVITDGLVKQSSFTPMFSYLRLSGGRHYNEIRDRVLSTNKLAPKAQFYIEWCDRVVLADIKDRFDPNNPSHISAILDVTHANSHEAFEVISHVYENAATTNRHIEILYRNLTTVYSYSDQIRDIFVTKLIQSNAYHIGLSYLVNYEQDERVEEWLRDKPIGDLFPFLRRYSDDENDRDMFSNYVIIAS